MRQQKMAPAVPWRAELIQAHIRQFLGMIAEPVDFQIPLRIEHGAQLRRGQKAHLRAEGKARVGGAGTDKIMVARDQDHLGARKRRKEIIHILQFPHGGRRVEQISCDQQQIDIFLDAGVNQPQQGGAHGISPGRSPGFVAIRGCPQMQIGGMDKTHAAPPSSFT